MFTAFFRFSQSSIHFHDMPIFFTHVFQTYKKISWKTFFLISFFTVRWAIWTFANKSYIVGKILKYFLQNGVFWYFVLVTAESTNLLNRNKVLAHSPSYHSRCKWRFLDKTDRTSAVKRKASNTGNKLSNAMSVGSENHDFMGIALSRKQWNVTDQNNWA